MDPLLNETGTLVAKDQQKTEVLIVFFALIFTGKTGLQESQAPEIGEERKLTLGEGGFREQLNKLDILKSMGLDKMHR